MAETFNISLDAMGGDVGPDVVLAGAAKCLEVRPELRFVIFGDEAVVMPKLKQKHFVMLRRRSKFHHCEVSVGMDDKPSQALRKGRYKSSMWRAIQAVRDGNWFREELYARFRILGDEGSWNGESPLKTLPTT